MLLDRYFDHMWHAPRVPSRLVRYGIIYGGSARDSLDQFEPRLDPAIKATAEKIVKALTEVIEAMEEYENATVDGPTEEDDVKAEVKAKRKGKS